MTISIQTNLAALQAVERLNKTSGALSTSYARLSTGLRITRPGDDPAGNQVADALKADATVAATAIRNAGDALSFTGIADSALSGVSSLLTRMAELAEQSANGVYANSQRSALANEFVALGSEIERIASTTQFNGISLLSNNSEITLQIGFDGSSTSSLVLGTLNGTLAGLGLAQANASALTFSINANSADNAQSASRAALDALNGALDSLNVSRGSLGAAESRLSAAVGYLGQVREQFIAAESRIRDVDVATEVAELTRLQVLQQAQTAIVGQANQQVSVALSLLG